MGNRIRIFKFSILMAFRSMNHRKFRTGLTIIGIMIGITTFVSLMSITLGMRSEIASIMDQFVGSSLMVSSEISGSRPGVPGRMVDELAKIPNVDKTTGVIMSFYQVGDEFAPVIGIPAGRIQDMFPVSIVEGEDLVEGDDNLCLIGAGFPEVKVGQKILLTGVLTTGAVEIIVKGRLTSTGTPQLDTNVVMTLSAVQKMLNTQNVQIILVDCDSSVATEVAEAVRDAYPEAEIVESQEILDMANQIFDIIDIVLIVLSAITLMVGAIGIMNTTMMNVLERTREIGIIKSIGGSRGQVVQVFITEAIIISIMGGIMGCLAAVGMVTLISKLTIPLIGFELPFQFPEWLFIVGIMMAVLIGFGSALYPSMSAASVKPVEALRYE
ncbi:MAG: FtsX-like permease family protein [Candidatus Lokiarchaeota archaeon]|nr:FtsX-like permease family protein [Candidatus Lokiarchaeota archaeon]